MRSPDKSRSLFEAGLRLAAAVAMVTLVVRFWIGATRVAPDASATSVSLDSALTAWSETAPRSVTLRASSVPDARQRDWLVALRRTGSRLAWTRDDTSGAALVIEPGIRPGAMARLAVLGAPQRRVMISDDLGGVDSVTLGPGGSARLLLQPLGPVRATLPDAVTESLGATAAVTAVRDSLPAKRVLVIGAAGWEAKFVAAALEEDGWQVSVRMMIAPGAIVRQQGDVPIDTATYGAVVVVDSVSVLDAAAVARFVNDGGGLVASGPGVRHPALRTLLPRQEGMLAGGLGELLSSTPQLGLTARTFVSGVGSVVFQRRANASVASGRRVGSGRVVVSGFDDTWRLRMVPPDEKAPQQHREWWSKLVESAALARLVPRDAPALDEAPFAAAVAALGRPAPSGEDPGGGAPVPWNTLLAATAALSLLGEWLSRRLRGVA